MRLKELREKKGLTQQEVADELGIAIRALQTYEQGLREPKYELLIRFADYYNVSIDYLLGRTEVMNMASTDMLNFLGLSEQAKNSTPDEMVTLIEGLPEVWQKLFAQLILNASENPENKCVVVYLPTSELPVSAGTGVYMDDYNDWEKKTYIDTGEYRHLARCFVLRVKGDSMEPEFTDGDFIAVDPELIPEEGEIGVYILDGEGYVKVLGKDFLHSLNEAYDDIPMNDSIHGCGKVIGTVVPAV